jgi:hypothetical protein
LNKKNKEEAAKSDQEGTEMGDTYNPINTSNNENKGTEIYDDKW